MKLFWQSYFLTGMFFALIVMAKFSMIGKPIEFFRFLDAKKYKNDLDDKIENFLITLLIVIACVFGWPIMLFYLWRQR